MMWNRKTVPAILRLRLLVVLWLIFAAPAALAWGGEGWTRDDAAHLLRRGGFGGTPQQVDRVFALGRTTAVEYLLTGQLPPDKESLRPFAAVTLDEFHAPSLEEVEKNLPPKVKEKIEKEVADRVARFKTEQAKRDEQAKKDEQANKKNKKNKKKREEMNAERLAQIRLNGLKRIANGGGVQKLRTWWIDRMVRTDRPLEEKMTLFWHGIFTSGVRDVRSAPFLAEQNKLLRRHATGNYKQLTASIVHDAAMLRYLNADQNRKGKPNENLARELMELFTMGEGRGYTEADIREVARALTGLGIEKDEAATFRPKRHDDGEKTVFGQTGKYGPDEVVNLIFDRPEPADYLARRLWQFFGHPAPAETDIKPVADALRSGNYELKPALRVMFTSDAFYAERVKFALIKSPTELMVETLRVLEAEPLNEKQLTQVYGVMRQMGQDLLQPPNVRGWPGGESWITSATLFVRYNAVCAALDGTFPNKGFGKKNKPEKERKRRKEKQQDKPNPQAVPIAKLFPSTLGEEAQPAAVVDAAVDRFIQRPLHPAKRDALIKVLGDGPVTFGDRDSERMVREMLGLLLSTPEYQVH